MTKFILGVVDVDGPKQLLRSLLAVDELAFGDGTGIQYLVSVKVNF